MKKKFIIIIILLAVIAGLVYGYQLYTKSRVPTKILTFKDCSDAGNLVVATKPRECHTKKGEVYIEQDNSVSLSDVVVVSDPKPYSVVSSPFKVEGKAKGIWYGNDRITIKLVDPDMKVITEKSVFALTDASQKNQNKMVPFVAALSFQKPAGIERGLILIEKASGVDLGEKNGPLIIPVSFK